MLRLIFLVATATLVVSVAQSAGLPLLSSPIQIRLKSKRSESSESVENQENHRRLQSPNEPNNGPNLGTGMHFLGIYFGNPAQMRTLAVSTSSAYTALPCEDCVDCGDRGSNLYNSSASTGFSLASCDACSPGAPCFNNRCAVGKSIQDLSAWSGYEVSDFAFHGGSGGGSSIVGTDSAQMFGFPLRFVCQTRTRGFFNNAHVMDGVLGLSPAPTSFLSQMHKAGKLEHPRFSLCFNDVEYSTSDTGTGTGVVTFGGYNQASLETEMAYAKKLDGDVYKVNITKLHLRVGGGRSVQAGTGQLTIAVDPPLGAETSAVVDSSTPFLTFDKRFEEPFRVAWKEATGREFNEARQDITAEEVSQMPTLLIELEGHQGSPRELDPETVPGLTSDYNVLVAVPAIHYMEHMGTTIRPYRAHINFQEENKGSIFGAKLMQGHTVSYEPDLNRIGFAESKLCQRSDPGGGGGRTGAGGSSGNEENADEGGSASVATSGGVREPTTATAATTPGRPVSAGTDDMFVAGAESAEQKDTMNTIEDDFGGGGCFTASCRSFMAIGYIFIGAALAVAYRVSRPKERTMNDYSGYTEEVQALNQQEDLSQAYRRKAPWNDDGPVMV